MESADARNQRPSDPPPLEEEVHDNSDQPDVPLHPLWDFIGSVIADETDLAELTRTRADQFLKEGDTPRLPPSKTLDWWASSDQTLRFAHSLLLHSDRLGGPTRVCRALVGLSHELTVRTAALEGTPLVNVRSAVGQPTAELVEQLEAHLNPKSRLTDDAGNETPDRRVVARVILHLHAVENQLLNSDIVGPLNQLFWAAESRGNHARFKRAAIFSIGSDLPLGVAAESYQGLVAKLNSDQRDIRHALEIQRERTEEVQGELEREQAHVRALESQAERAEATAADLEERLKLAEQRNTETRAHASSDFEDLRARVGRQLHGQRELLDELSAALEREPPKVAIASERVAELFDQINRMLSEMEQNR